jgi:hypothetical protein
LARERLLHVSLLAVGLAAAYFCVTPGPDPRTTRHRPVLFDNGRADCVWAGDSRIGTIVRAGLRRHPELLAGRVVNFSFPLARFTPDYLAAVERQLAPSAAQPTIVLGVTPHALVETPQRAGWLERLRRQQRWERWLGGRLPAPVRIDELVGKLWRAARPATATSGTPPADAPAGRRNQVTWYKRQFAEHRISRGSTARLLRQVAHWSRAGIRVCGVRPPVSEAMLRIEAASGFDERRFARRFEQAGGIWINLSRDAYATSDGSHLTPDAAAAVYARVARVIAPTGADAAPRAARHVPAGEGDRHRPGRETRACRGGDL